MDISEQNYKEVSLKDLCLNSRLGDLNFEKSYNYLNKLKDILSEFERLGYEKELSPNEQGQVSGARNQYIEYLKKIQQFDLNQPNPSGIRDALENEIENFYNSTVSSLRNSLTYLRQESILKSQDQEQLQKERERIVQVRQQLEVTLKQLQEDLEKQKRRKKKLEETKGAIAATQLAHHFAKQSNDYAKEAEKWLKNRKTFFKALLALIIINYVTYLTVFVLNTVHLLPFDTGFIFSIEYGVINLSLLSLLFYSLRFASQNYNIFSNLEAVTRHRKNVALTLDDFLGTNPAPEIRDEMIKQGTEAMFKHLPTGYIPKSESKDSNPVNEVINYFLKRDSE